MNFLTKFKPNQDDPGMTYAVSTKVFHPKNTEQSFTDTNSLI